MATLNIAGFSTIESAKIDLGDFTILVGPQASGKSVISKLIFFCYDILSRQFRYIESERPFEDFQSAVANEFKQWFPPTAWGQRQFEINFSAGPYQVRFRRGTKRAPANVTDQVSVTFSDYLANEYAALLATWISGKRKATESDASEEVAPTREIEYFWGLRDAARTTLRKDLRRDYVGYQLFIPAGRSFFTSLVKSFALIDNDGMLDPITTRFGRLFASTLDQRRGRSGHFSKGEATLAESFFGGRIIFERDKEYVLATDGRRLPFSLLSSGQQELLPLWIMLPPTGSTLQRLVFIEEPEAHLFPSAQAQLTNHLASLAGAGAGRGPRLFITTHSPYVLSTVNNLMKAFSLSKSKPKSANAISKSVPKASWLPPSSVRAYAIKQGNATSILSDDLIDGEYLDDISGHIARIFSELQAIEFSDEDS